MENQRIDLNKPAKWRKTCENDGSNKCLLKLFSNAGNTNRIHTSSISIGRETLVCQIDIFRSNAYFPNETEERKQVCRCVDQVFGLHTPKLTNVEIVCFKPDDTVMTHYQAFVRLKDLSFESLTKADELYDLINGSVYFDIEPEIYFDRLRKEGKHITPNMRSLEKKLSAYIPITADADKAV